jgi:predicted nucleotidyltransferase
MAARHDPERPVGQVTGHPVQEVLAALGAHLGDSLRGLVLFGSRARGDAQPESDWDLLAIADGLPASLLERSRMLRSALPARWCGRAAIIAKTPQEFEAEFPAYYLDIAADGRILHDSDGYLEDRLNRIRQRIREAGLQRRKLEHGFVWTWEMPPRGPWRIDWDGVHGLDVGR